MKRQSAKPLSKPGAQQGNVEQEARTCPVCGTKFSAAGDSDFCPVCILRGAAREQFATDEEAGPESPSDASSKEKESTSPVHRFENYELILDDRSRPIELGRGAMGVTYKAFDVNLRCPVTLKVISERYLGDESARLRFLREARAAASVRHPNVASVFHLGRTGTVIFTRWSLWREKRLSISSNAQADSR